MSAVSELNERFGLPGTAVVVEGNNGLTAIRVTTPQADAEIYLLGGQVTRWKPPGFGEVLWLSGHSNYTVGKAIRGGVPVCFPWFGARAGDPRAPSHGFVRTREWRLESIARTGDGISVAVVTTNDSSSQLLWPAEFELRLRAIFGSQLTLQFELTNTGEKAIEAEAALHAYFTVGDVRETLIQGLDQTEYLDKTDSNSRKMQSCDIRISSETDRVYLDTEREIEIHDPVLKRRVRIAKQRSRNTVVWNPWIEKAHSLADFGDNEWQHMVCVEPANVGSNVINVAPREQRTMTVRIAAALL